MKFITISPLGPHWLVEISKKGQTFQKSYSYSLLFHMIQIYLIHDKICEIHDPLMRGSCPGASPSEHKMKIIKCKKILFSTPINVWDDYDVHKAIFSNCEIRGRPWGTVNIRVRNAMQLHRTQSWTILA